MTRLGPVTRSLCELRRPLDWVRVGALRGALIGGVLPVAYGVAFVAVRVRQSTIEPTFEGQTSASYSNTAGGAWGYAAVTVLYVGVLLLIAIGIAATLGTAVGTVIGASGAALDSVVGRLLPPVVTATLLLAAVAAATYPGLAGRTLLDLDPDPWVVLVAVPLALGLLSLWALPLRRTSR